MALPIGGNAVFAVDFIFGLWYNRDNS